MSTMNNYIFSTKQYYNWLLLNLVVQLLWPWSQDKKGKNEGIKETKLEKDSSGPIFYILSKYQHNSI